MRAHAGWSVLLLVLLMALAMVACGDDDDDDNDAPADDDNDAGDDDATPGDDDTFDDGGPDGGPTPLLGKNIIYDITGTDSIHGAYSGQVEIRADNEAANFIRTAHMLGVSFVDPRLETNYDVHTAWTGRIDRYAGIITVSLQVADFITAYGDTVRSGADGMPVVVSGTLSAQRDGSFTVAWTTDSTTHPFTAGETWTYHGVSGDEPLFQNEDTYVASHDPPPDLLTSIIYPLLSTYHALECYDDYRDRDEFWLGVHYLEKFRTDFDWYREHPDALRVFDKWLDEISMAEAMLRARAYSPTLAQKAEWFDAEFPDVFLNETGFVGQTLIGSDPLEKDASYDALLWNGCYLGSQVFRYLTTGEPEALANWLQILDAQFFAHDIVQDDTSFARAVRPHVEDGSKEWIHAAAPYEDYDWMCCGNNDMIQGLYYAYTLSWIYLPEDAAYATYRAKIAERAARLADHASIALDGEFNDIKATWLAWMTTGDESYRERYQELYNILLQAYTFAGGGMFYLYGVSDWSGQHLDAIGQLVLYFLAKETGDNGVQFLLKEGWANGMRLNAMSKQILWPIASHSFSNPPADLDYVLDEAIWGLREFPYPKQNLDIDQRIDPQWCASPLPSLFWKLDYFQGGRHQGLFMQPWFEKSGSINYFVCNPLDFQSSATEWSHGGGTDYLHAYWMGRYFGVIDEQE